MSMFSGVVFDSASRRQHVPLTDLQVMTGSDSSSSQLCARLTPPPVPPWLLDSSDKLRHLMANCSSWQAYSKLCAEILRDKFPALWSLAKTNGRDAINNSGVQWIPTAVAFTLMALMLLVVLGGYFLYRHDGIWCKLKSWRTSAVYRNKLSTPSVSRDYCSPGPAMSPSVTVETQLSLWALEDHPSSFTNSTAGTPPFTVNADPSVTLMSTPSSHRWTVSPSENSHLDPHHHHHHPSQQRQHHGRPSSSSLDNGEVLLQPHRLADSQLPVLDVFPRTSLGGYPLNNYASLDLEPSLIDGRENELISERYSELPVRNKNRDIVKTAANTTTTSNPSLTNPDDNNSQRSSQRELFTGKHKRSKSTNSHKNFLKTCQNAGAKLVTKISRKPSIGNKGKLSPHPKQQRSSAGHKIEASFARLRQSLSDSKLSRSRGSQSSSNRPCQSQSVDCNDRVLSTSDLRPHDSANEIVDTQQPVYENITTRTVANGQAENSHGSGQKHTSSLKRKVDGHKTAAETSVVPSAPVLPSNPSNLPSTESMIYSYAMEIPPSERSTGSKGSKRMPKVFSKWSRFLKKH